MATATTRKSAEERRQHVIDAAVKEFASHGYHAASTSAIARRAGISQPYIYALFPDKKALFLAVHRHVVGRIEDAFCAAAAGAAGPDEKLAAMGDAYLGLLDDRDEILCQLQAHAAAGEPELREEIRQEFERLFEKVGRVTGAPRERVADFFAKGMLLNVVAALDLTDAFHPTPAGCS
ncbi:MAG TPA: TetR/AcrR family transcriptional regulator [Thermoleophilaceae bacterium]|nr:TetR/AcrR family transcriptional regulator [Thermoleophilaceae bacterium]